jgi:hypothetical protein
LGEVEVAQQIAELRCVLPHVGARVGPTVVGWVETLTA